MPRSLLTQVMARALTAAILAALAVATAPPAAAAARPPTARSPARPRVPRRAAPPTRTVRAGAPLAAIRCPRAESSPTARRRWAGPVLCARARARAALAVADQALRELAAAGGPRRPRLGIRDRGRRPGPPLGDGLYRLAQAREAGARLMSDIQRPLDLPGRAGGTRRLDQRDRGRRRHQASRANPAAIARFAAPAIHIPALRAGAREGRRASPDDVGADLGRAQPGDVGTSPGAPRARRGGQVGRREGQPDRPAAAEQRSRVGRRLVVSEHPQGGVGASSAAEPSSRSKAIMLRLVIRRSCSASICWFVSRVGGRTAAAGRAPSNHIGRDALQRAEPKGKGSGEAKQPAVTKHHEDPPRRPHPKRLALAPASPADPAERQGPVDLHHRALRRRSRARRRTSRATSSTTSTRPRSIPPRSWPGARTPRRRPSSASPRRSASRAIRSFRSPRARSTAAAAPPRAWPRPRRCSTSTTPSSRPRSPPITRTSWLSGSLLRTGPAKWDVPANSEVRHWFDGLAALNRFGFADGDVSYRSRFLDTRAYRAAKTGRAAGDFFGTDPCRSIFKRVQSVFSPDVTDNANVNLVRIGERYIAMTETPLPDRVRSRDAGHQGPDALRRQERRPGTTAHPHHDPARDELVNYSVHFARKSEYRMWGLPAGFDQRRLIARLPVAEPAYMHAFGMSERYLILAEYPLRVNPLRLAFSAGRSSRTTAGSRSWAPASRCSSARPEPIAAPTRPMPSSASTT